MDIPVERWPGCPGTRGISGFTARPEAARTVRWFKPSDRPDSCSTASGEQVESRPEPQGEEHWWFDPETWASGGTWQNGTYDDYNYQYQWTKTWVPDGQPEVTDSATNHVTGIENGTATGWSFWSITRGSGSASGSGSGSGTSFSSSWSTSWSYFYDETVNYPGFYAGAYYSSDSGGYSGGGGSPEEHFAYLGDAFNEASSPGSGFSSATLFPFAYGDEGQQSAQGQTGGKTSALGESPGQQQIVTVLPGAAGQPGVDGSTSYGEAASVGGHYAPSQKLSPTLGGRDVSGERVLTARAATTGEAEGGGFWDWVQGGLDVVGCVPLLGEPADAANAVISVFRGDWTGAGLSAVSIIPGYGDAVGKGGKLARWLAKYGNKVVAALDGLRGVRRVKGAVRSFKSFDAFKAALGPAGDGKVWHHILEQRPSNIGRFGPEAIHNTANVVAVPREVNQKIADYYSRKRPWTGGKTVREFLDSQSYEEQMKFGQMILEKVIKGEQLP